MRKLGRFARNLLRVAPVTAGALAAVLGAGALLSSCGGSSKPVGVKGRSEVAAQPVSTSGANPFTAAVGMDTSGVSPPPAAAAAGSSGGPPTYSGSTPGLYGGTLDHHSCDANKLITFLEQNPGKAAAWAQTLGIQTSQIRDYVNGLTAVTLRTDTRVTNHGYIDGRANPIQAVLEAGTAVFVDRYGRPVVKCYCGNPLTSPELLSTPTYSGSLWSGFDPGHITIINQSTTIINVFKLYDFKTGKTFLRTPGSNGTDSLEQKTPAAAPAISPPYQPETTHTETTQHRGGCAPYESGADGCSPPATTPQTYTPHTDTTQTGTTPQHQLPQCDPVNPYPPCRP